MYIKVIGLLLLCLFILGCSPKPTIKEISAKIVIQDSAAFEGSHSVFLLVASDNTKCIVSAATYANRKIGESVSCSWDRVY